MTFATGRVPHTGPQHLTCSGTQGGSRNLKDAWARPPADPGESREAGGSGAGTWTLAAAIGGRTRLRILVLASPPWLGAGWTLQLDPVSTESRNDQAHQRHGLRQGRGEGGLENHLHSYSKLSVGHMLEWFAWGTAACFSAWDLIGMFSVRNVRKHFHTCIFNELYTAGCVCICVFGVCIFGECVSACSYLHGACVYLDVYCVGVCSCLCVHVFISMWCSCICIWQCVCVFGVDVCVVWLHVYMFTSV